MLWLEVKNNKKKSFQLCYCCRLPSASTDWSEKIERSLERANLEAKEIYFKGDFYFILPNKTNSINQWIETTDSFNFKQLVNSYTQE